MDVCTLILTITITTQACWTQMSCEERGDVRVCVHASPTACRPPPEQYDCKRPDGTHYIRTLEELNLPKG